MKFGEEKLESWGYQTVKKSCEVLAFFVLTQYRRVTDRQTDGQTDGQTRCDRYYPR